MNATRQQCDCPTSHPQYSAWHGPSSSNACPRSLSAAERGCIQADEVEEPRIAFEAERPAPSKYADILGFSMAQEKDSGYRAMRYFYAPMSFIMSIKGEACVGVWDKICAAVGAGDDDQVGELIEEMEKGLVSYMDFGRRCAFAESLRPMNESDFRYHPGWLRLQSENECDPNNWGRLAPQSWWESWTRPFAYGLHDGDSRLGTWLSWLSPGSPFDLSSEERAIDVNYVVLGKLLATALCLAGAIALGLPYVLSATEVIPKDLSVGMNGVFVVGLLVYMVWFTDEGSYSLFMFVLVYLSMLANVNYRGQ